MAEHPELLTVIALRSIPACVTLSDDGSVSKNQQFAFFCV